MKTTYTSTTEEDPPPFNKVSEQINWLEVESLCSFNTDSKIDLLELWFTWDMSRHAWMSTRLNALEKKETISV